VLAGVPSRQDGYDRQDRTRNVTISAGEVAQATPLSADVDASVRAVVCGAHLEPPQLRRNDGRARHRRRSFNRASGGIEQAPLFAEEAAHESFSTVSLSAWTR